MNVLIGAKTHFSLGESIYDPEQLIKDVTGAGWDALVVTDTSSIDAMPILSQKAGDLKIGLAVQIAVVEDLTWKPAKRGEPRKKPNPMFMTTLMVRNEEGFRDLAALMTLALDEDHFSTKPSRPQLLLSEVIDCVEKGNVDMTLGSAFSAFSLAASYDIQNEIAARLSASQAFVEIVPVDSAYYDKHNEKAIKAIEKHGFKPILTRPTLHRRGDAELRTTMNCILDHTQVTNMFRREPVDSLYVMSPVDIQSEINRAVDRLDKAGVPRDVAIETFKNATESASSYFTDHTYSWEKLPVSLPKMAASPLNELVDLCKKGWSERLSKEVFGYKPSAADITVYRERLKFELDVLRKMGFEDYFLLVRYIVDWSRSNGIMTGPGRGSVGGSLIAYLLGITDVDPIRFGLYFERFLNPERIDLPDIDLDFMSSRRQDVIEHLVEHFGSDKVACIANYSTIAGSGALREVSKVFGLPESEYECSKMVPKEQGTPVALETAVTYVPELEKFALAHPAPWRNAVGLQGCFRNYAQHAAGVIVAGEPVVNRAVVNPRSGMGVVNWDKRVVEDFGLIKLDVLGLANLDVLRLAKDYVRETAGVLVDYTSLPLNDPEVMKAFSEGKTLGVFQFESGGMRRLLKELGAEGDLTFEDITAATALYRPGPMQSGLMDKYIAVKRGFEPVEYVHPKMEPALRETYSVFVYQEQVMQIARDLAGFTMAEADGLRKAMGKKDASKMAAIRDQFVNGCDSFSGLDPSHAATLFDQIEKFAGYGFNKSHAVAYTLLSYMTMWVKTKYPEAFFAACLTILPDDRLSGLAKDALAAGIYIVPPDVNKSSHRYEIGYDAVRSQKVLYAPFQSIKGLAERGAKSIVESRYELGRPFKDREDFVANVNRRLINIRQQANLDKVGAFASIEPGLPARHPDRLRDQKELLPGIVVNNVKASRDIIYDGYVAGELKDVADQCAACSDCPLGGLPHPSSVIGKKPKMMIVTDMPNFKEEGAGILHKGDTAKFLKEALTGAGFKMADVYLTTLIKARKPKEMEFENSMINGCSKFLQREIELLKPPVIVALGSKTIRHLVPDVKGGWEELCGKSHYDVKNDCTVVFGLNPAQISFDPGKQELLNAVFEQVADIFA